MTVDDCSVYTDHTLKSGIVSQMSNGERVADSDHCYSEIAVDSSAGGVSVRAR